MQKVELTRGQATLAGAMAGTIAMLLLAGRVTMIWVALLCVAQQFPQARLSWLTVFGGTLLWHELRDLLRWRVSE